MRSDRLPLSGVRVLDLSRVLAGPFCTQVLADLGAECIKVERPGTGDDTRHWGPPFHEQGSAYFLSLNRNKRSVAVDLGHAEGRRVLDDLLRRSDVLIENFLPATAEKLGLAPERLDAVHPHLVRCSITGFGLTGPWKDRPGYDFVIQALSGLMSITGEPDGEPMKVGVAITDVLTGLFAATSALAGLVQRQTAGRGAAQPGAHFDVAMLDCTVASLVNVAQAYLTSGEPPRRYGNAHAQIVPYECFATADGFLVLAVGNDSQWRRFCETAGRADLATDARFATNPQRVEHRATLVPEISELMRGRTTGDWIERLTAANVPHAPVLSLPETLAHPQTRARQLVVEARNRVSAAEPPAGHDPFVTLLGAPIKIMGCQVPAPTIPPRLGQHTDAVLSEVLGYSGEEIARLRRIGVIA